MRKPTKKPRQKPEPLTPYVRERMRKAAIEHGLDPDTALAALEDAFDTPPPTSAKRKRGG